METGEAIDTGDVAAVTDGDPTSPEVRDYEAEARQLGWQPQDEFKGDGKRFVDAKTFVERGEALMPLLKAQLKKERQEMQEMKREFKREMREASDFFAKAEERAYKRALAEIEQRHDEAVATGDGSAARKAISEMRALEKDFDAHIQKQTATEDEDPAKLQAHIAEWIDKSDWYGPDENKTKYADFVSNQIITNHGALHKFPGGLDAALAEIEKRVATKFAERKPAPNAAPGRPAAGKSGKTFADLPPEAKATCDRWVKQKLIKDRDAYVAAYQWD